MRNSERKVKGERTKTHLPGNAHARAGEDAPQRPLRLLDPGSRSRDSGSNTVALKHVALKEPGPVRA